MRFRVVLSFLSCYVLVVCVIIAQMGQTLTVGGMAVPDPVIIVDAGHGGFDGGAEGINGSVEKDINLPIALKVRDLLTACGYRVIMTRESDTATCSEEIDGISAKKTSDIMNRFALLEKHPQATFISIHQNKFPDSSQHGAQIFYGPNCEQSQLLAQTMQENFKEMLAPENTRQIKKAEDGVYLLYHSPIPSVMVECGFLSNEREAELLQDDEYQNQIAFVVAASLMEYFQQGYYPQADMQEFVAQG